MPECNLEDPTRISYPSRCRVVHTRVFGKNCRVEVTEKVGHMTLVFPLSCLAKGDVSNIYVIYSLLFQFSIHFPWKRWLSR